jgi:hypothetical protein
MATFDRYCFLPLYVFAGQQLLGADLRPANIDASKPAWAILALLVKQLRQAWPKVEIVFRGDSGFCRWKLLRWCERHEVKYIVGVARNSRLQQLGLFADRTSCHDFAANQFRVLLSAAA